jgi:hypothetical protein
MRIPDAPWSEPTPEDWAEEFGGYIDECQDDLQAILANIQQSNELALKARICAVSPYLLLLESQVPLSNDPRQVDFFDLRTIDAQKLPQAVNTLCETPLPPTFVTQYEKLRRDRNRYTHLGHARTDLNPLEMLIGLADLYADLWPGRPWLRDHMRVAARDRVAGFGDKFWNPSFGVLNSWSTDMQLMPPARFRRLFGINRAALRYLCHECRTGAETAGGMEGLEAPTAFRIKGESAIRCLACMTDWPFAEEPCHRKSCKGRVMGAGPHQGACHVCGHRPEDWQDEE